MLKFPRDLYSDVRVEDVAETTLVLEDGELKQCTESRRRGAFVRVYDGKRWYNSATTEPDRLQQELDTLAAMAEPNPAIGDDPVVRRFEVNRDCVLRWQAGDLRAVPVEQKLALLRSYQPPAGAQRACRHPRALSGCACRQDLPLFARRGYPAGLSALRHRAGL